MTYFNTPHQTLGEAIIDARKHTGKTGETLHIIYSEKGYEIVGANFVLDRNYYHNEFGRKIFFDFQITIS